MIPEKAVTEVFIRAFNTLPFNEQRAFMARILKQRKWRKDLIDIAIAESRSQEKSRSFRDFLATSKK